MSTINICYVIHTPGLGLGGKVDLDLGLVMSGLVNIPALYCMSSNHIRLSLHFIILASNLPSIICSALNPLDPHKNVTSKCYSLLILMLLYFTVSNVQLWAHSKIKSDYYLKILG